MSVEFRQLLFAGYATFPGSERPGAAIRQSVMPGELLDFILGWTTIDIFNDDLEWKKRTSNKGVESDQQ